MERNEEAGAPSPALRVLPGGKVEKTELVVGVVMLVIVLAAVFAVGVLVGRRRAA